MNTSARPIIAYTETVAAQIRQQFSAAPMDELRLWLQIAHQRESMVTELYGNIRADDRFAAGARTTASTVTAVINSIWAHEESHTTFLSSLRSLTERFPVARELQGSLEGMVTKSASAGGLLGRALIALGASVGQVPDFARDLNRMTLRELLAFHAELEATARLGYERILELARALQSAGDTQHVFGFTLAFDVSKILAEEKFHEAVFETVAAWLTADGAEFRQLTSTEGTQQLHALCRKHLAMSTVMRLADPGHPGLESVSDPAPNLLERWASDGGLGEVFQQHGLSVPVRE